MGNLIKNMKEAIAKSGTSKKDILYFAADSVHRVRFLQELEDGEQFQFHSDFNASVNALCEDPEDHESCPYCQDEIKLVDNFAWTVWDYDSNSVKIFRMKASGVSPVPALIDGSGLQDQEGWQRHWWFLCCNSSRQREVYKQEGQGIYSEADGRNFHEGLQY